MYVPEAFAENDRATLLDLIRATEWGYLVGAAEGVPFATHLPFLLEGDPGAERLVAHMARANPHWQSFAEDGREQLVIFAGPHTYVSPRWYTSAKAVPTWNYVTVHVYGVPRVVDDPAAVYAAQKRLVDFNEAGAEAPWRMEDVDAGYIEGMLRAIVSFEMPIARMEGKFKLSQNRKAEDRAGVIAALSEGSDEGGKRIARLMASREAGPEQPAS
jgi:transcriptional regulator